MITTEIRSFRVSKRGIALTKLGVLFEIAFCLISPASAQISSLPLSSLTPLVSNTDQAHYPTDTVMNGRHYSHAITSVDWNKDWTGVTAPDGAYQTWRWVVSYHLNGQFKRLTVDAGIKDGSLPDRIDQFEVHANGINLGITPPIHVGYAPEHFDIDLTGVRNLDLIVTSSTHDGNGGKDGAVWGDPTLVSDHPVSLRDLSQLSDDQSTEGSTPDVFSWEEVPVNADVPITRSVIDSEGYHLFDTQNEVIVVPFGIRGSEPNIFALKFGRSSDSDVHFVNNGDDPVLYMPESAFINISDVPDARWFPITSSFHSSSSLSLGMAFSWDDYRKMLWFPGMTIKGATEARFGKHSSEIESMGQYTVTVDGQQFNSSADYAAYCTPRHSDFLFDPWDADHYNWALHPPTSRHGFDHDHRFSQWGDHDKDDHGSDGGNNHPGNQGNPPPPPANPPLQMNPPNPIRRQFDNEGNNNAPAPPILPPTNPGHPVPPDNTVGNPWQHRDDKGGQPNPGTAHTPPVAVPAPPPPKKDSTTLPNGEFRTPNGDIVKQVHGAKGSSYSVVKPARTIHHDHEAPRDAKPAPTPTPTPVPK